MNSFRKSFTVSEIDTYDKCPLQYRLQYVERIPGASFVSVRRNDKLPAHVTGDIVHNAILRLTQDTRLKPETALKAAASSLGVRNMSAADTAHLKSLIQNFISWRDGISSPMLLAEWPFVLDVGGIVIRGTIDCLCKTQTGWVVADYKTDRIDSQEDVSRLADEYELQMSLYSIAAESGLGSPIHSTVLHFLEVGERVEKEVSATKLDLAMEKVLATVEGIRNHSYETAHHPHRPCARCAYHHNKICWDDLLA